MRKTRAVGSNGIAATILVEEAKMMIAKSSDGSWFAGTLLRFESTANPAISPADPGNDKHCCTGRTIPGNFDPNLSSKQSICGKRNPGFVYKNESAL
jgi:hypothetical protein